MIGSVQALFIYSLIFCATAHLVAAATMALFARHKVEYLAIAWILGIFAAAGLACIVAVRNFYPTELGILHPMIVLALLVTSFLQSIYPLSFTMPGYLQWRRMLKYASPAAAIVLFYCVQRSLGKVMIIDSWSSLWNHIFDFDVLLRFAALGLSMFYISGIIVLPRRMLHDSGSIPGYVKGYCTAMSLAFILLLALSLHFNETLMLVYIYVFTLLNLYLMLRTLEIMALRLLQPVAHVELSQPEEEKETQADAVAVPEESDDFNEANANRFARTEHYMMHTDAWADSGFGREKLCRETGINRHLMLQALRSQGWNNIHEYINSYRVARLKRLVETHHDPMLVNCCYDAGFGTIKTARSAFERFYGVSLDSFWEGRLC